MDKREFYKKLMGEKWFTKEILTKILEDIGSVQKGREFGEDGEVQIDEDGITFREEYNARSCGCCYEPKYQFNSIYWDDLVEDFFERMKEDGD